MDIEKIILLFISLTLLLLEFTESGKFTNSQYKDSLIAMKILLFDYNYKNNY